MSIINQLLPSDLVGASKCPEKLGCIQSSTKRMDSVNAGRSENIDSQSGQNEPNEQEDDGSCHVKSSSLWVEVTEAGEAVDESVMGPRGKAT